MTRGERELIPLAPAVGPSPVASGEGGVEAAPARDASARARAHLEGNVREGEGSARPGLFVVGLWGDGIEAEAPAGDAEMFRPASLTLRAADLAGGGRSRRRSRVSDLPRSRRGKVVGSEAADGRFSDLAWFQSLLAAAVGRRGGRPIRLEPGALLRRQRARPAESLLLFLVDASGSMGGALMALASAGPVDALKTAYVDRQQVAMIVFAGRRSEEAFGPTRRVERVGRALKRIPLGGTTPLAVGLARAEAVIRRACRDGATASVTLALISDGRANVGLRPGQGAIWREVEARARRLRALPRTEIVLLDTTAAGKDAQAARRLANSLGAEVIALRDRQRAVGPIKGEWR